MENALETQHLGKRYGKRWVLRDCTLTIPQGQIAGLVGVNGAGKTTLMQLIMGLQKPDEGSVSVLGTTPHNASLLPHISFIAQERPIYRDFSVKDMLTFGRKLNPLWDQHYAEDLVERFELPEKTRVNKLSGGQQVQVALIVAIAKRPEMLILDEPFANVDPLARRQFMEIIMEDVADRQTTVMISSHQVSELENVCDRIILLAGARVQLADTVEHLQQSHKLLTGPRAQYAELAHELRVLYAKHGSRQSNILVQSEQMPTNSQWDVQNVSLEEIILAHMEQAQTNEHVAKNQYMEVTQ